MGGNDFEMLLEKNRSSVERFVFYRIPSWTDAEDILQETYIAAFQQFRQLKNRKYFKTWLFSIARHKCADYFRKKGMSRELPFAVVRESPLLQSRRSSPPPFVYETIDRLNENSQQLLYLYYWHEWSIAEIAEKLNIPIGTVKSRLYTARQQFRNNYPNYLNKKTGGNVMKKLPDSMPIYTIHKENKEPFSFHHEELPGMFIIPKYGETLSFGMYDFPERKFTGSYTLNVTGKIVLHGVEGVEIASTYTDVSGTQENNKIFAQLNDSHCRYLGGETVDMDGCRRILTFLDGEDFERSYAIGDNNCGFPTEREPCNTIRDENGFLTFDGSHDLSDIVGRYSVKICGKSYDTVRLIDIQSGLGGIMLCEYYVNSVGRTVLMRRFNSNSWAFDCYGKRWTDALPENERMIVNGETFVHWYDCITDFIL